MPALILFGASTSTNSPGADRTAQLRVQEDADDVVGRFANAQGGFADFTPANKPKDKVWVNRDQVRMVRSA